MTLFNVLMHLTFDACLSFQSKWRISEAFVEIQVIGVNIIIKTCITINYKHNFY